MKTSLTTFLFCIGFLLCSAAVAAPKEIKILKTNTNQNGSIDYFYSLLTQALDVTEKEFGEYRFKQVDLPYSQERSLHFLNDQNILDVMHTMTNAQRELKYTPVKVPLLKGLMGYRMLITNTKNLPIIEKFEKPQQLKNMIACQGQHWPDSDILEHNGFQVARVLMFEAMFEMVEKGRCDFFPRGIHEIFPEYETFVKQHPSLKIVKNIILHYQAPVYFFVGKKDHELAMRIDSGLKRLINTGRFDQLLKQNPITARVFPLEQWKDSRVLQLENPKQDRLLDTSHLIKLG